MVCPSGTANSGNGLSTCCSFKLQRSAISIVRAVTPGASGKQPRHLVRALHKKLVGVKPEPLLVVNLRAGLHAQHHIVRMRVLAAQVMRVVGQHQRNVQLPLQPKQVGLNLVLLLQALVLNLEKEIPAPEDVLILLRDRALGLRIVALPSALRTARRSGSRKTQSTPSQFPPDISCSRAACDKTHAGSPRYVSRIRFR